MTWIGTSRGYFQTREARVILSEEQGHRCCYCGRHMRLKAAGDRTVLPADATIEHVNARGQGGHSGWGNVVVACSRCNRRRGAMSVNAFFRVIETERQRGRELVADELKRLGGYGAHLTMAPQPSRQRRPTLADIWSQQALRASGGRR